MRSFYLKTAVLFVAAFALIGFDRGVSDWLHDTLRPIDSTLQFITLFGDGFVIIPACIISAAVLWLMRAPSFQIPLASLVSFLLSGALTQILKTVIGRARPYALNDGRYLASQLEAFQWFTLNKDFASFPSGHATAVFSVAWVIANRTENKMARYAVLTIAFVISFSRVALAKHYIADTVAGAALGMMIAHAVLELSKAKRVALLTK